MVRVLEKGSERKFIVDCGGCKSKLEYMEEDIIEFEYPSNYNRSDEQYIRCPECGYYVEIKSKTITI